MANLQRHSYVQFYPSDWIGGVAYMPPMVEWTYLQICLHNWDKRAPMPDAEAQLRLSRNPDWLADVQRLIAADKVVRTQSGSLFVPRAIAEAERAYDLWEKKSRGGRGRKIGENQSQGEESSNTPIKGARSNENENENESDSKEESQGDFVFSVPDKILKQFREHRRLLKAPLTPHAQDLMIKNLERIHSEHGHDPTAVLNQSIERGWKGVFPIKDNDDVKRTRANGSTDGLFAACVDDAVNGNSRRTRA